MNELEKIRAWNALKDQIAKIYDYKTRGIYYKALLAHACSEWGFNPENPGQQPQTESVELDDWEQEFVEDIQDTVIFGIDVRKEKRENMEKVALGQMKLFIETGGKLSDIPEQIRTKSIQRLYWSALFNIGQNLRQAADDLLIKKAEI